MSIKVGDIVTIQNLKTGETKTFQLVNVKQVYTPVWTYNTKKNMEKSHYEKTVVSEADGIHSVSIDTPIGKACLGKVEGSIITCSSLIGKESYKIIHHNSAT